MGDLLERLEEVTLRTLDGMAQLAVGSKEHHLAAKTFAELCRTAQSIRYEMGLLQSYCPKEDLDDAPIPDDTPAAAVGEQIVETEKDNIKEEAATPWEEDAVVVEKEEEYTKEAVRQMLSDASQNGIQIRAIISKYVPEGADAKFSSVPKSRYNEIVKELRDAK